MNVRRFFYAIMHLALFMTALIACTGNDDVLPPGKTVSAISFTDNDPDEGWISGTLRWVLPDAENKIDSYNIYVSNSITERELKIDAVARGHDAFEIPVGTPYRKYILIVAANKGGESSAVSSLAIIDYIVRKPPLQGAYVLNSGEMNKDNATLDFIDFKTQSITNGIFPERNNRPLGVLAQDMMAYGEKIYILVSLSETVEVTDLDGNSIKTIKTQGQPRAIAAAGKHIYVTLFNGYVMKVDTAALDTGERIEVGRNPEQIVVANNKLYIANSGGLDWDKPTGYDRTVSVIDIPSFKETKKIEVSPNPANVVADNDGGVYVASWDYATPPVVQRIDSKTDEVEIIEGLTVTEMVSTGRMIYYFHNSYDGNPTYGYYDTKEKTINNNFIKDSKGPANPYKIFVDKDTENLFITTSDYVTNGEVHFFFAGAFMQKWTAGINPIKMIFVNRK